MLLLSLLFFPADVVTVGDKAVGMIMAGIVAYRRHQRRAIFGEAMRPQLGGQTGTEQAA